MITGRKRVNLLVLNYILSSIEGNLRSDKFEPYLRAKFFAVKDFIRSYEKLFEADSVLNENTATIYGDEILTMVNHMQISLHLAEVKGTNVTLGNTTYYVKHL